MTFYCYSLQTMYCWPELIKRTLSRSEYSTRYNHPQLFVATSLLVALAVLGEYFCACCYVSYLFLHVQNFRSIITSPRTQPNGTCSNHQRTPRLSMVEDPQFYSREEYPSKNKEQTGYLI